MSKKYRQTTLEQRITQTKRFFTEIGSVCPYAKNLLDQHRYEGVERKYTARLVIKPLLKFMQGNSWPALVYVFEDTMPNHDLEQQRAIRFFRDIYVGVGIHQHGFEAKEYLEQTVDDAFSPNSQINLFLNYNVDGSHKIFFAMTMNPLYGMTAHGHHPRYAPVSLVVITRETDITSVKRNHPEVRALIRARVAERVGTVYDGDQYYLPP